MPAPGDQHRETAITANPFHDNPPRISEYTAQEIATLQSRLEKQLGPEFISSRAGAGGMKVHYIAAEKVINLANEVFGFNGWSSQIQNVQIDFIDENPNTGKITLGLSTIVRVTLRDGTFHEDIGYGAIENCKGKAAAFEKAKKEGVTDALKRALRNFGNVLGNCLYDKEYLARVTKVKVASAKWDAENLHRHPDVTGARKEEQHQEKQQKTSGVQSGQSASSNVEDLEDEFGGDFLGEVELVSGCQDELDTPQIRAQSANARSTNSGGHPPGAGAYQQPQKQQDMPPSHPRNNSGPGQQQPQQPSAPPPQPQALQQAPKPPQQQKPLEPPVGFITSRAAEALTTQAQPNSNLSDLPRFNPNAESPSIRKTSGVNHTTSAPISKALVSGPPAAGGSMPAPNQGAISNKPMTTNYVNPSENFQRKIGAPSAGAGSPLANRTSYKPPSVVQAGMKRPYVPSGVEGAAASRSPLADVSNVPPQANVSGPQDAAGEDTKRPRMAES